jgi:hypothetical protein
MTGLRWKTTAALFESYVRLLLYELPISAPVTKTKEAYLGGAGRGGFGPNARAVSR